jgi:excisionase family DNA binding protein
MSILSMGVTEMTVVTDAPKRQSQLLLAYGDVAKRLNCGVTKVRELCGSGAIKTVKIGRLVRVRERDLDAYIDSLDTTAA